MSRAYDHTDVLSSPFCRPVVAAQHSTWRASGTFDREKYGEWLATLTKHNALDDTLPPEEISDY